MERLLSDAPAVVESILESLEYGSQHVSALRELVVDADDRHVEMDASSRSDRCGFEDESDRDATERLLEVASLRGAVTHGRDLGAEM